MSEWQTKGELQQAEEHYPHAIRADPGDGEITSQYAKLVWELHQDRNKAMSYFEQAAQASPGDRYIFLLNNIPNMEKRKD